MIRLAFSVYDRKEQSVFTHDRTTERFHVFDQLYVKGR